MADTFLAEVLGGDSERDWVAEWDAVYASLFGPVVDTARKIFDHSPVDTSPSLASSAYTGTYANEFLGEASVVEDSGVLVLKLGPARARCWRLRHFDRDLFVYTPLTRRRSCRSRRASRSVPTGKRIS
jgi:hypothetical protein